MAEITQFARTVSGNTDEIPRDDVVAATEETDASLVADETGSIAGDDVSFEAAITADGVVRCPGIQPNSDVSIADGDHARRIGADEIILGHELSSYDKCRRRPG